MSGFFTAPRLERTGDMIPYMDRCAAGGYYSPAQILSYNRYINIITGRRSIGKSTGVSIFCLLDFLMHGRGFMYVRRREQAARKTAKKFFQNADYILHAKGGYPHTLSLTVRSKKGEDNAFYISVDGAEPVLCGAFCWLSDEDSYKSGNFSYIHNVIYDEFISRDKTKYLGTLATPEVEWDSMCSLYETIDRDVNNPKRGDTRVFLMGNTATIYNPVYLALGIPDYLKPGARFIRPKDKGWVLETSPLEAPADDSPISTFASASYLRYSEEDAGDYFNSDFVEPPHESTVYRWSFKIRGKTYGVRENLKHSKWYIVSKIDPAAPVYSFDGEGYTPSCLQLITSLQKSWQGQGLQQMFAEGALRFDRLQTKYDFMQYFSYI